MVKFAMLVKNKILYESNKVYLKILRRKLKNNNPTIIASDCFGTFMYHNLGLKFNSPTINLYITTYDFHKFVRNLPGFIESDVTEIVGRGMGYPVGKISYNGEEVTLNFMHYKNFEEARNKWNERKRRIDYSNIFIVQLVQNATIDVIEEFDKLPYDNKMLVTNNNLTNSKNVRTHSVFDKRDYHPGQILDVKNWYGKRYMDDIDYITFLNHGCTK